MSQARVVFFGLSAIYLLGVVVQFFLAGLGVFGAESFDAHRVLGFILGAIAIALIVLAALGRLPRVVFIQAILLLALNVVQIVLANVDTGAIAALHVVNALVIFGIALELMQRSRRYLASKIAA
jgi:hypothetical protein